MASKSNMEPCNYLFETCEYNWHFLTQKLDFCINSMAIGMRSCVICVSNTKKLQNGLLKQLLEKCSEVEIEKVFVPNGMKVNIFELAHL